MNYNESINYLNSFIDYEKLSSYNYSDAFKLDRVERLLERLGNPHRKSNFIHIAGSKGKGSTAALLHSILKNSGLKTGLYTSPHLLSFNERIRVNGGFISNKDLTNIVNRVRDALDPSSRPDLNGKRSVCPFWTKGTRMVYPAGLESLRRRSDGLSFFEIYTACAFLYFSDKKVDFAILETGLGGRLDATNVVYPKVAVITSISYEHMDKLGKTLSSIATEKAGIIKEGCSVVSSLQLPKARQVLREISRKRNAVLFEVGSDIRFKELEVSKNRTAFDYYGLCSNLKNVQLSLLGAHQILNAATAIGVTEILQSFDCVFSEDSIRRGLKLASWPGRFQLVKRDRLILLDGAQNRGSSFWLAKSFQKIFTPLEIPRRGTPFLTGFKKKPVTLILGVSKDKDVKGMARELCRISKDAILTRATTPRALKPELLREKVKKFFKRIILKDDLRVALAHARKITPKKGIILITGSLYLVSDALKILKVKVKF